MSDFSHKFEHLATNLVHAGAPQPRIDGAVITPIFQSANYLMQDESTYDAVRYIRLHNSPNHHTLHARLAAIESGESALVTASGMAAISAAILAFVGQGEHLLTQPTLYGGTQNFLDEDAPRFGIEHSPIDLTDPEGPTAWERALRPETRMLYVEAISNPLMEVFDLEAVVAFGRKHDLITLIDSTFTSPVNFRALEIGFDLVVHSATKYLNGHSDLVAGAVIGSKTMVEKVRNIQLHLGAALDPHTCFLLERGLKTLELRVERQNDNAMALAQFLDAHPRVRKVCYPGLADDPGFGHASRLFSGFGGMLSFYAQSPEIAASFLGRVRIPLHAASLGAVESLVVRPARSSHLGMSPQDRERLRITDDLVRVSVGIENIDELRTDFDQALG